MPSIRQIKARVEAKINDTILDLGQVVGLLKDPVIEGPLGKYVVPINSNRDLVAQHIKQGKLFDEHVVDTVKRLYKGGDILDIGANFGQMSVQFSRIQQHMNSSRASHYHLYSFEANPVVFKYLNKNISMNCRDSCTIVFGAVWNEVGKTAYFPYFARSDEVTYGTYKINFDGTGFPVTTISVDALKLKNKVGLIKTDIQGADLRALEGAIELIKRDSPIIITEYESRFSYLFNDTFEDYINFFNSLNYEVIMDEKPQPGNMEWSIDLVCIPKNS